MEFFRISRPLPDNCKTHRDCHKNLMKNSGKLMAKIPELMEYFTTSFHYFSHILRSCNCWPRPCAVPDGERSTLPCFRCTNRLCPSSILFSWNEFTVGDSSKYFHESLQLAPGKLQPTVGGSLRYFHESLQLVLAKLFFHFAPTPLLACMP